VHHAGHVLPLPVARVSGELAQALIAGARPPSLDRLQAAAIARARAETRRADPATSFPVPDHTAEVVVDITRTKLPAANVMGRFEGNDPVVRDAFVLVGAHFDHDGVDARGRVMNGADDNASGVAGVLEIAEAFSRLAESGRRPRRAVVFALWNAEEHGLLGSQQFADELAANGHRAAAVLNLDMIGRDEHIPPGDRRFQGLDPTPASRNRNALHLLGYTYSPQLLAIAREENAETRLTLRTTLDEGSHRLVRRSDHWPFLQARTPALFFFTGLHPDYHTPDDDVERLNIEKMARIVRLAYRVAWRVADAPAPPAFVDPPSPE
jgi:Zn-dependent M28 family amino/carboxypeptidase